MKAISSPSGFSTRVTLHAFLIVVFLPSVLFGAQASQEKAKNAELEIQVAGHVTVDEAIRVILKLKNAADIAGYEAALLFDTNIAEFGGLFQRDNDIKKIGRDIGSLTAVDLPSGVGIGFYSCPTEDCVQRKNPNKERGGNGAIHLATIYLFANQPGSLEIRLDAVKLVDANGNPIQVTNANPTAVVQVETGDPFYPAPGAMWSLPDSASLDPGPFDLTEDGLVTHADAMEVATEWESARLNGEPCGALIDLSRDVNHDGCIDVADVQLVAANYSTTDRAAIQPQDTQEDARSAMTSALLTFTVNSTGDQWDSNPGNGICKTPENTCTLRAAIQEANRHNGPDTINFNIPGSGVQTIKLSQKLTSLNDSTGPTTIDGYTQPGSSPNTSSQADNAVILVQIEGGGETNYDGIVITSPGNVVRGLALYKFRRAFWIYGANADNNIITGNFIGTDATGTYGSPSLTSSGHGINLEQGASSNRVGGPTPAERNVISGNSRHGGGTWHENSDRNMFENNIVGLSPLGDRRLSNRKHGLDINYGSSSNIFRNNVISGNDDTGIEVSHTDFTRDNQILNNYIGTDVTGNQAPSTFSNNVVGMTIEDGASYNTISDNVVGNNNLGGIRIDFNAHAIGNILTNNRLGVSLNGSAIGNRGYGIQANGVQTRIGPGNIIAFNKGAGINISGTAKDFNTITQNSIYSNGGLGINLAPSGVNPNDAGDPDTGPNEQLNYPVLQSASTSQVTGTACAGCTVEIFIADNTTAGQYGEGKTFVGVGVTDANGNFTVQISGVSSGNYVTSTATDSSGNTSEFSLNLRVP